MEAQYYLCLVLGCMFFISVTARDYDMSTAKDCALSGYVEIPSGSTVKLNLLPRQGAPRRCRIDFRAEDENEYLELAFLTQTMDNCDIEVTVKSDTKTLKMINCRSQPMDPQKLGVRLVTISIFRKIANAKEYNIKMTLKTYKDVGSGGSTEKGGLKTAVIIGIVAGILVFLAVLAIIILCCLRKRKGRSSDDSRVMVKRRDPDKQGFNNSALKNGASPQVSVDIDDRNMGVMSSMDMPASPRSGFPPAYAAVNNVAHSDHERNNRMRHAEVKERSVDAFQGDDRSPLMDALKNNQRFRRSFADNENDANNRFQRISQTSEDEYPPAVPPPLPVAPKSPVKTRKNPHASIRRAPRPASSSEEIQQLEIPIDERGDFNIQLIPESPNERGSLGDVVPIHIGDSFFPDSKRFSQGYQQTEERVENIPDELSFDDEKPRHTLRPNRSRGDKQKPNAGSGRSQIEGRNTTENAKNKRGQPNSKDDPRNKTNKRELSDKQEKNQSGKHPEGRSTKQRSKSTDTREPGRNANRKGDKSPKLSSLGRRRGGSLGRELDDDYPPSRPDTPTSMYSNAPLQRSGSRQSLYASRTSLYSRRRRGSYSESVATQDDASLYDRSVRGSRRYADDDRESHFRRNRSNRSSRSMGDVRGSNRSSRREFADYDSDHFSRNKNYHSSRSMGDMIDTGTQTLYETGTQTGSGYLNKPGRRHSARKSPKTKRNQALTGNTKSAVSTAKAKTVEAAVGPDSKPRAKPQYDADSDDSVTKIKRKMAAELNERIKKPKPIVKSREKVSQQPVATGPPSYDDSQKSATHPLADNAEKRRGYQTHDDDEIRPPPMANVAAEGQSEEIYMNLPPVEPILNKPQSTSSNKSPWAVLCDLTDSDYKSHSSIHSGVPDYRPTHAPPYQTGNYAHSETSFNGRYPTADTQKVYSDTEQIQRPRDQQHPQQSVYPQKSSWETLQQMADPEFKGPYRKYYDQAESNV